MTAAKGMETPWKQSSPAQNKRPPIRFEINPDLSEDVHEPTSRERTCNSEHHIREGADFVFGCITSAEKAAHSPNCNRNPGSHKTSPLHHQEGWMVNPNETERSLQASIRNPTNRD